MTTDSAFENFQKTQYKTMERPGQSSCVPRNILTKENYFIYKTYVHTTLGIVVTASTGT